jgi:hypothetical protein
MGFLILASSLRWRWEWSQNGIPDAGVRKGARMGHPDAGVSIALARERRWRRPNAGVGKGPASPLTLAFSLR